MAGNSTVVNNDRTLIILLSALLALLLAVAGLLAWDQFRPDTANAVDGTDDVAQGEEAPGTNGVAPQFEFTQNELTPGELGVKLSLIDYNYQITGTVPDIATQTLIITAADQVMQGSGMTNIVVDPQVANAEWGQNLPNLIKDFADSVLEGELLITETETKLSGVAPIQPFADALVGSIESNGLPTLTNELQVENLTPPTIKIVATGDKVELSGALPNESIRQIMFEGTEQLYGVGNVTNNFTVDDAYFAPYRYIRFAESLAVVRPFGNYEVGNKNGVVYGIFRENLNFESGSAQLTEESAANVARLSLYLNATATNGVSVVGHTDSDGSPESNQVLSVERAENIEAILIAAGVDANRIQTAGKGESEPFVPNDTDTYKLKNRRVEIQIQPVSELN